MKPTDVTAPCIALLIKSRMFRKNLAVSGNYVFWLPNNVTFDSLALDHAKLNIDIMSWLRLQNTQNIHWNLKNAISDNSLTK